MVYMGQGENGTQRLFGARGTGKTGLSGSGVDFFSYRCGGRNRSRLMAYGRPPLE